jgi:hypothetical protein
MQEMTVECVNSQSITTSKNCSKTTKYSRLCGVGMDYIRLLSLDEEN